MLVFIVAANSFLPSVFLMLSPVLYQARISLCKGLHLLNDNLSGVYQIFDGSVKLCEHIFSPVVAMVRLSRNSVILS